MSMTDPFDDIAIRRAVLKKSNEEFKKDIEGLVAIQPAQFDILKVATTISSTPPRKWKAAQAVVEATFSKKEAERNLKTTRAKFLLRARHDDKLKAAPDRQAWVDDQEDVQTAEIELINADAALTSAKLAYECLDDVFTAFKKIMDYLVRQDEAVKQYDKYLKPLEDQPQ